VKDKDDPLLGDSDVKTPDYDDIQSNRSNHGKKNGYKPPKTSQQNRNTNSSGSISRSNRGSKEEEKKKREESGDVSLRGSSKDSTDPLLEDGSDSESIRTVSGDSVLDLDIMEFQGLVRRGFLRKRGHMMRNWKRRFGVMMER